jgi:hypothetical protein
MRRRVSKMEDTVDEAKSPLLDCKADELVGSYMAYGAVPNHVDPFPCEVYVNTQDDDHKQLRAFRLKRLRSQKRLPRLRKNGLHHELLVIFGPQVSPRRAVSSLRNLARYIEKHGLLIGRKCRNGDFLVEHLDGTISE